MAAVVMARREVVMAAARWVLLESMLVRSFGFHRQVIGKQMDYKLPREQSRDLVVARFDLPNASTINATAIVLVDAGCGQAERSQSVLMFSCHDVASGIMYFFL